MATTFTDTGEIAHFAFPIVKTELDENGDLIVFGRATDGTLDSDRQIVDPAWAAKAVKDWLDTGGNVRVQHNPMRDPAGKGISVETMPDGSQWVKALIVEPVAKDLVKKGVLRSYSVGIMHPVIKHHPDAPNGLITGGPDTCIGEISLVDRPANKNCTFQLVKAAASGGVEWVGKLNAPSDVLNKASVTIDLPHDVNVTFTPADLAKMLAKRKMDPDVGGGVDRDAIPGEDFAGPGRSYPIVTPKDVHDAGILIGHAEDPDAVKSKIIAIAKRKGEAFVAQLPDAWKKELGISKGIGEDEDTAAYVPLFEDEDAALKGKKPEDDDDSDDSDEVEAEAEASGHNMHSSNTGDDDPDDPDTDEDEDEDGDKDKSAAADLLKGKPFPGAATPFKKKTACGSCGKKGKAGRAFCAGCGKKMSGPDDDGDKAEKSAKPCCAKCGAGVKAKSAFCPGCGEKVAVPDEVKKGARTKPTPADGVTGEHADPVPAHREPDGPQVEAFEADADLPTDPDAAVKTAINHRNVGVVGDMGVLHDLLCPAYSHKAVAAAHPYASLSGIDTSLWQSKALDAVTGATLEEAKAATDRWNYANLLKGLDADTVEELRDELHKAFRDANVGPGSAPTPSKITPGMFKRPYIAAGNARPSFEYAGPNTSPAAAGQIAASQFTRDYLGTGRAEDSPANKDADTLVRTAPETGKPSRVFYTRALRENARQAMVAMHDHIAHTYPDICPMGAAPAAPEIPIPAPGPAPTAVGKAAEPEVTKAAAAAADTEALFKAMMPDLVKSAVAEATAELAAQLERTEAELKKQRKDAKELRKTLDEMADLPDPRTAPWKGAAQPGALKSFGGGTPPITPASIAERSQLAVIDLLRHDFETSTDPVQREAALKALRGHLGV